jgi:hypothetical protein
MLPEDERLTRHAHKKPRSPLGLGANQRATCHACSGHGNIGRGWTFSSSLYHCHRYKRTASSWERWSAGIVRSPR